MGATNLLHKAMKKHGVSCLVVFGSTARGEEKRGEDLDLGVLFSKDPSPADEQNIVKALTCLLPEEILDIAVLNHASPLLNFHVARDGKVLFEARKGDFLRFKMRAVHQYWDTARFRKMLETFALREVLP